MNELRSRSTTRTRACVLPEGVRSRYFMCVVLVCFQNKKTRQRAAGKVRIIVRHDFPNGRRRRWTYGVGYGGALSCGTAPGRCLRVMGSKALSSCTLCCAGSGCTCVLVCLVYFPFLKDCEMFAPSRKQLLTGVFFTIACSFR